MRTTQQKSHHFIGSGIEMLAQAIPSHPARDESDPDRLNAFGCLLEVDIVRCYFLVTVLGCEGMSEYGARWGHAGSHVAQPAAELKAHMSNQQQEH